MINNQVHITPDEYSKITTDIFDAHLNIIKDSGGSSMFPILKAGDKLIIKKIDTNTIKKGDIIVGTINNKTIGHRVIKAINSKITTQGDNCRKPDTSINRDAILGLVTGYIRAGKEKTLSSPKYRFWRFMILYFGFIVRPATRILFKLCRLMSKAKATITTTCSNLRLILSESKPLVIKNVAISFFQGIFPFVIIYLIKRLVDSINAIQTSSNPTTLFHLEIVIAITGLVFLLGLIINSIGTYTREQLSQSVSLTIYNRLHTKHSHLKYENIEDPPQQEIIHRATIEAGFRPMKLVQASLSMVRSCIAAVAVLALMFSIHWMIAFVLFIGLLPSLFVRFRFSHMLYQLNKKDSRKERQSYYYNRVITGIPFAKELRLFATAPLFISRFNSIQKDLYQRKNRIYRKQLIADIISQTISIVLIFVAFGFVAFLAIQGKLTIGTVVLFFLVFQRGFVIIKDMLQSVATLYEDNIFFADFTSFLHLSSTKEAEQAISTQTMAKLQKGITVDNVSFQYPSSSRKALDAVSMTIPAGKTVALVGANGSGKTTLVKLLCGFYQPTQGTILFDNIALTESNQEEFRKEITAVFQDFALYNMTASENIWMGNPSKHVDTDKVKESARMAGIHDVLKKLPAGFQNMIGNYFEKGEELSIGQWQKLAIARAFYRDSQIVMMDEPSSALDAGTETQIISHLRDLATNKTVLIISHRFSSIQWADIIYVMDEGKIVESGNHQELMNLKGHYCELYSLQKSF